MSDAIIEAFELARFAEQLAARLAEAHRQLPEGKDHRREREWLEAAEALVTEEVAPVRPLLARARLLPELSFLREEVAEEFQNAWVDGLEKLLAGITFHAGSRAPVLEALFPPKTKLPALRRASRETSAAFQTELERRLKSSYVTRMFAGEDLAFAAPVVEAIRSAFAQYVAAFEGTSLSEEEATSLRTGLSAAARSIELRAQQAKLLAEAALVSVDGAFENAGLNLKPKKRRTAEPAPAPAPVEEEQEALPVTPSEVEGRPSTPPAPKQRKGKAHDAAPVTPSEVEGRSSEGKGQALPVTPSEVEGRSSEGKGQALPVIPSEVEERSSEASASFPHTAPEAKPPKKRSRKAKAESADASTESAQAAPAPTAETAEAPRAEPEAATVAITGDPAVEAAPSGEPQAEA